MSQYLSITLVTQEAYQYHPGREFHWGDDHLEVWPDKLAQRVLVMV
jgi:hypothetical protein